MFDNIIAKLKTKIDFDLGLTDDEIIDIEKRFDIKFPLDLKEFYQKALPISDGFVNWRDLSENNVQSIRQRLNWPLEGMLFDVENNAFWYPEWGERPADLAQAKAICIEFIRSVPKLIPIYSHRYIPMEPDETNNPIFSVYQTDIIYYGDNLEEYLNTEFFILEEKLAARKFKHIKFWSNIAS